MALPDLLIAILLFGAAFVAAHFLVRKVAG